MWVGQKSPCRTACRPVSACSLDDGGLIALYLSSVVVPTQTATKQRHRKALKKPLSLRRMLATSQTRKKSPFVLSLCRLWGTVGRELEQAVRVVVRWHWIHGSCFLQCFMPTATAALQMRVNIAGEPSTLGRALSHGLNVKPRPAG